MRQHVEMVEAALHDAFAFDQLGQQQLEPSELVGLAQGVARLPHVQEGRELVPHALGGRARPAARAEVARDLRGAAVRPGIPRQAVRRRQPHPAQASQRVVRQGRRAGRDETAGGQVVAAPQRIDRTAFAERHGVHGEVAPGELVRHGARERGQVDGAAIRDHAPMATGRVEREGVAVQAPREVVRRAGRVGRQPVHVGPGAAQHRVAQRAAHHDAVLGPRPERVQIGPGLERRRARAQRSAQPGQRAGTGRRGHGLSLISRGAMDHARPDRYDRRDRRR